MLLSRFRVPPPTQLPKGAVEQCRNTPCCKADLASLGGKDEGARVNMEIIAFVSADVASTSKVQGLPPQSQVVLAGKLLGY